MTEGRQEQENFEQDRFGNVRRELDAFRAQEGNFGQDTQEGIVRVDSTETGADQILYSLPTHVTQAIVVRLFAFNSAPSGDNTFTLLGLDLDGSGNISSSTRRSVPIAVDSSSTRIEPFEGEPFQRAIGVNSDFEGHVGVGLIADHEESDEPDTTDFSTPS